MPYLSAIFERLQGINERLYEALLEPKIVLVD